MITYDKDWWGNRVLFRLYGSAFPRAMPHAIVSAVIAATLSTLFHTTGWRLFNNSYPVQMFFFIVGFMVIFRSAPGLLAQDAARGICIGDSSVSSTVRGQTPARLSHTARDLEVVNVSTHRRAPPPVAWPDGKASLARMPTRCSELSTCEIRAICMRWTRSYDAG